MRCQQCGQEIEPFASTCPYCGTRLQVSSLTVPTPQTTIQQAPAGAVSYPTTTSPSTTTTERCLVCGATIPARNIACPQCRTPRGMVVDPYDPTCSRYLLVVPQSMAPRSVADRLDTSVLSSWHWGAAFLTLFWAWSQRLRAHVIISVVFNALFLLVLGYSALFLSSNSKASDEVAVFFLLWTLIWCGLRLYYGFSGMQIARQSGRYSDLETFLAVQKKWQRAGLIAFIGYTVLLVIGLVLININNPL
ncbi:zinc ribbon domain-containing protein [Chthonomonas calidirosea]|uniref:zinc ribbon domain-containing protein n=1 Tax=Chthonomonas calidirosea TaxID=454171 RepID=UPI0006EC572A|nr:zinc ribbon domain-containing protein [Chthonomonas calidirosea]CEK13058.1 Double zinc ribbon [Chthonomonas calidirosea]